MDFTDMDWPAWGTVVALAGVAVSFIFSLWGQIRDGKVARTSAERAERAQRSSEASAERSEKAASLTIDTLARIANAVENLGALGVGAGQEIPRVSWSLTHSAGDEYKLENIGTAVAFRVQLSADKSLAVTSDWPSIQDLKSREAVTFQAARDFDTTDSTITVSWSNSVDAAAQIETWRYPLPTNF